MITSYNGKTYDFNGNRVRGESEMMPCELAAKAQKYLNRYFKAVEEGNDKKAAICLNAAESTYARAASAKY